ncbi:HAD-IIA family hydrolase [Sagittula sp. S175]|uniref:HAD-IIA family hydrolase n=1 Tax=Sagittula sp. S175 TaxID=3415129 RepID=UPI003C7CFF06
MPRHTAAVFDIDGTLALMDKTTNTFTALPGALDALAYCRTNGITPVAYTNGTFFPPAHYYPLLAEAGITFDEGHILTPAHVAAQRLKAMGYSRVMVLGGDGTTVPCTEAGLEVIKPTADAPPVEAVLMGYTRDFNAEQLEAVIQAVWNGAKPFAGSKAPFFAGAKGRTLGISGALSAAVEYTTGQEVALFGKPSTEGLAMVTDLTGTQPEDMIVIGDDPNLEIRMGRSAGSLCIGVTTGISDTAAFNSSPEAERAHHVLPSLETFPALLDTLTN